MEAGAGVDPSLVGARVVFLANSEQGTWADRTVVPARHVVTVGEDADAADLAQISINPVTALVILRTFGDLKPGSWRVRPSGTERSGSS